MAFIMQFLRPSSYILATQELHEVFILCSEYCCFGVVMLCIVCNASKA